jgi:tetratricopeptide (TPR) repeat protein
MMLLSSLVLMGSTRPADDWNALGLKAFYSGNYQQAEQLYQLALAEDPNHVAALYNLGMLRHIDGVSGEPYWLRVLEIDPNYENALFNLANFYAGQKKREEAIAYYVRLLQIKGQDKEALFATHNNVGSLYFDQGEYALAERHFLAGLKFKVDDKLILSRLIRLYEATNEPAKMKKYQKQLDKIQ